MRRSLLAAAVVPSLLLPQAPAISLPKPAILKPESLELSRHMLLGMPMSMGVLAATRKPFALNYVSSAMSTTAATSYTYASMSLGSVAVGTRHILICTHGCVNSTSGRVSSVTVGGNAATRLYFIDNLQGRPTEIWYYTDNSLTSGNVVVTYDTQQFAAGVSVWNLNNPSSITPSFSNGQAVIGAASNSLSITVPASRAGLAIVNSNVSGGAFVGWTNATQQYLLSGPPNPSGAKTTTAGTYTVTATYTSSTNITMVVAAWS